MSTAEDRDTSFQPEDTASSGAEPSNAGPSEDASSPELPAVFPEEGYRPFRDVLPWSGFVGDALALMVLICVVDKVVFLASKYCLMFVEYGLVGTTIGFQATITAAALLSNMAVFALVFVVDSFVVRPRTLSQWARTCGLRGYQISNRWYAVCLVLGVLSAVQLITGWSLLSFKTPGWWAFRSISWSSVLLDGFDRVGRAPFVEELQFRAVLLAILRQGMIASGQRTNSRAWMKSWFAVEVLPVVITAAVFMSMHWDLGAHGWPIWFGIANRFSVGVILAVLYRWSGSLWIPIAVHSAVNAFWFTRDCW